MDGKKARMTELTPEGSAIVAALNLSLGGKIDAVETKLDTLNSKVNVVESKVEQHEGKLDNHEARIKELEAIMKGSKPGGSLVPFVPRNQRKRLIFGTFPENTEKDVVETKLLGLRVEVRHQ